MSSFAALMALSATQTRQSEALVKSQMAEKQRKEAEKRKQQEERERKEKEMEAKMRLKILDDQKREQERQKKFEAERQAKELALKKKEDEQRDALRYGPKRSKSEYPSSNHASREKRKSSSDDEGAGGAALTREEKRQQRLQRELNYGLGAGRRSTQGAYRKAGRRLPGGAVDIAATDGASSSNAYRSVKDRLAHEPNGLIKLNVNKRDTRTIDEITQDLARHKASKVLSGDQAKTFDNWFGKSKPPQSGTQTGDQSRASSIFSSRSNSPVSTKPPEPKPISSKPAARATKSLSGTPPAPSRQHSQPKPSTSTYVSSSRTPVTTVSKGTGISVKAMSKPFDKLHINGSSSKIATGKAPMKSTSSLNKSALAPRTSTAPSRPSTAASSAPKKRPRSPSLSDSPPPPKRRSAPPANSISAEIWKMFGKDRNAYVGRDVLSDEEDMEADAMDLEHEELYRLARKEDELAMEEERRHEEEKRRRKKERDSRERRG
ncbi:hypothetical protein PHLCEN_2v11175 [Hermanssonia centrifuga]|uniref:SPT2 chromatin protein n=1 Tax=Hermanssonia centrifuga TaxID=98765 RepID=A0A2R6NL17_9APHY|nr:hypothetical protein PHLCEN_2v11175 [Hermanssonia centrifuga]